MKRLEKTDWINQGFEVLKTRGAAGLTINNLTRALGRTKGSFYHHFKNREDFLTSLLCQWEKKQTRDIIRASSRQQTFNHINQTLTALSHREVDPKIEVAIRAWALRDPLAREYQARIDAQRVGFLRQMFSLIAGDTETSDYFAMIRYCFYIGSLQIIPGMDDDTYHQHLDCLTRMFERFAQP